MDGTITCNEGYNLSETTCVLCETDGNTVCSGCPTETPYWDGTQCGCPANSSTTIASGKQLDSTACYCNTGYVPNTDGTACVTGCLDNKDCNNGSETGDQYCKITNYTAGTDESNYWSNLSGTCTSKGTLPTAKSVSGINTYDLGELNWWSAKNICSAHGKRLFMLEEFQCYRDGTDLAKSGAEWGYCCSKGNDCGPYEWPAREKNGLFSPTYVDLASQFGLFRGWVISSEEKDTPSSKTAAVVYVYYGALVTDFRSYNQHAICRDEEELVTCPENSSTTVMAGRQLGSTACYCNTGYVPNTDGDSCLKKYTLISSEWMDYETAKQWCIGQGSEILSVQDLDIKVTGKFCYFPGNEYYSSSKACKSVSGITMTSDNAYKNKTADLFKQIGPEAYWTKEGGVCIYNCGPGSYVSFLFPQGNHSDTNEHPVVCKG